MAVCLPHLFLILFPGLQALGHVDALHLPPVYEKCQIIHREHHRKGGKPLHEGKVYGKVKEHIGCQHPEKGTHHFERQRYGQEKAKEDQEIELVLDMAKTHVFEKGSEKAIY
jgi:hypothetical protein